MVDQINKLINLYVNTDLEIVLEKYRVDYSYSIEQCQLYYAEIKKILIHHYLMLYGFNLFDSKGKNRKLLQNLEFYYKLFNKIRIIDDFAKVYPVKTSDEELRVNYVNLMSQMVEYHISTGLSMDRILDKFADDLNESFIDLKNKLYRIKMKPYYGSLAYMINRILFICDCIRKIPDVHIDIDEFVSKMDFYKNKYLIEQNGDEVHEYDVYSNEFYYDYDMVESYYLNVLDIEKELTPYVIKYWKEYLTDPGKHNDDYYHYIMHTFSSRMVDPSVMHKVCCALNTDELIITPYGNCGLIYDIDVDSLECICAKDAGSWKIDRKQFVDRLCPSSWQLTNPDGDSYRFENSQNSKLFMPESLEDDSIEYNYLKNGDILNYSVMEVYSEILLNESAKAVGVFYTDKCKDIETVIKYAEKYNLPLVHISINRQRSLKCNIENNGMSF